MAADPEQVDLTTDLLTWARWDDGDLRNAAMRDSLLAYVDRGDYAAAAVGYARLLPRLRSLQAAMEIKWRLAQLEFVHLNQKGTAVERMRNVIASLEFNSLREAIPDSMYKKYVDTYGTMCYNLGLLAIEEHEPVKALSYFMQSAEMPWTYRAKAYLEISKLSSNDPRIAVKMGKMALAQRDQLEPEEIREALVIVIKGLRMQRNFDEAKIYFQEFQQFSANMN